MATHPQAPRPPLDQPRTVHHEEPLRNVNPFRAPPSANGRQFRQICNLRRASGSRRFPGVNAAPAPIVVVSGLPRSGTSLMMQMLSAGGMPVLTDGERTPDPDNPRGYLELERVKQLKSDTSWLATAHGHAVKIIHLLLQDLPTSHRYDVLLMERDISEVLRSQSAMLARSGRAGAPLPPERLAAVYQAQLATVRQWLSERPCFRVQPVRYSELVAKPVESVEAIRKFLTVGSSLDAAAMAAAVDPSLYRNR